MKKSGNKSIFHIYFIFFLLMIGALIIGICILLYIITIQKPDGKIGRSDWPKNFTESFGKQIVFLENKPKVKQSGLQELQKNHLWLQIINKDGMEEFSYQKPENEVTHYSALELLQLYQTGGDGDTTVFLGSVQYNNENWIYIIHFPVRISKITMYLDAIKFTGGKSVIFIFIITIFFAVIISGIGYGYWLTKNMSNITNAIQAVAKRKYIDIRNQGSFEDVYNSLNALDTEIRVSDKAREQTEKMREEWIANITHDLKTPLSPIKGYAELLLASSDDASTMEIRRYAKIILKNITYIETLIDDLKLTHQLENEIISVHKSEKNFIRFIKELIIDILNNPDYESRIIKFYSEAEYLKMSFNPTLLTRALNNLIINALVHGDKNTEVFVSIHVNENKIQLCVLDNGKGMSKEELGKLFTRYYRGTNTGQKPEGTGLGLVIAKQVIELHKGTISASSKPGNGVMFNIIFPLN